MLITLYFELVIDVYILFNSNKTLVSSFVCKPFNEPVRCNFVILNIVIPLYILIRICQSCIGYFSFLVTSIISTSAIADKCCVELVSICVQSEYIPST